MWKPLLLAVALMGLVPGAARSPIDREPLVLGARLLYGPRPGFDSVDADLISRAARSLDMAAYVLSDHAVIDALGLAARRGVKVRIYLDPEQNPPREAHRGGRLAELLATAGVEARVKSAAGDLMHMKSYQVDGRWVRSGSANFSFSGESRQDNDLVVLDSVEAASVYAAKFEEMWRRRDNARYAP